MKKVIPRSALPQLVQRLRAAGQKIVFTNGCFDILHVGHVRYLAAARALGDVLIVGLNSDASVTRLKGPTRPLNTQDDRAEVLAALAAVDYVIIFDDPTAANLVAEIKPDVYVKGGDYRIEDLPEARIAASYGGRTVLVPLVPGKSTTGVVEKIKSMRYEV